MCIMFVYIVKKLFVIMIWMFFHVNDGFQNKKSLDLSKFILEFVLCLAPKSGSGSHTCQPSVIRTETPSQRWKAPSFDDHLEIKKLHINLVIKSENPLELIFAPFRYFVSLLCTAVYGWRDLWLARTADYIVVPCMPVHSWPSQH